MGIAELTSADWAQRELEGVQLGDRRLNRRGVKVLAALGRVPSGTLPGAFGTAGELNAAYRLCSREAVSFEALTEPHVQRTRGKCRRRGEYLIIGDTTELNFTREEEIEGLGWTGNPDQRGFLLHSGLAVRVEGWLKDQTPICNVVGLSGLKLWSRKHPPRKGRERRAQRQARERESQKWGLSVEEMGRPGRGVRWTRVEDREADIAAHILDCQEQGHDYIIRAAQRRVLEEGSQDLFGAVRAVPRQGRFSLSLRARPGQAAREAQLEVRATTVTLRPPRREGKKLPPLKTQVVEVLERRPPPGVAPLHWVLLTSWRCDNLRQSLKVAKGYGARYLVEEYHKALKSGTQVESSQLTTASRLSALVGLQVLVAVRLLGLKLLCRARPNEPAEEGLLTAEMWEALAKKFGKPGGGWTWRSTLVGIARLGGFLARKSDGDPGWQTIWRGWQRLTSLAEGIRLAHDTS